MVDAEGNTNCLLSGSNAVLTCEANGFPRPPITFRKDQDLISSDNEGFESMGFPDQVSLFLVY